MSTESLAPQVRISLDGRWLAWRSLTAYTNTWTVIALAGGEAMGQVTNRAVEHWHALVSAAPLIASWREEIARCVGEQSVEACSECMGLSLALESLVRAAQL